MIDNSVRKVGGVSSILLGISYALIGITYVFLSHGEKVVGVGDPAVYYTTFLQNKTPAMILYWLTAIGGVFGIAAVQGISEIFDSLNKGWVKWTGFMAAFGFAIKALDSFRGLTLVSMRAEAWVAGDASTRAAIGATRLTFDYYGWFTFGAVGLWVLVVSLLISRKHLLPQSLGYIGIICALSYELVMSGFIFVSVTVLTIGLGVGTIAGTVWYTWSGIELLRINSKEPR